MSARGSLSWRRALGDHLNPLVVQGIAGTVGREGVRRVEGRKVRKTKHVIFPRGPSGAGPGWMPPKQCYFISLMGHNNRCTFHHLSFGVIIGFPAINSTRIPINLSVWLTICVVTEKVISTTPAVLSLSGC